MRRGEWAQSTNYRKPIRVEITNLDNKIGGIEIMDKNACFIKLTGEDHDGHGLKVTAFEKFNGEFPPEGFVENPDVTVGFMDLSEQPVSPGDYTITECDRVAIATEDRHQAVVEVDPDEFERLEELFEEGNLTTNFE